MIINRLIDQPFWILNWTLLIWLIHLTCISIGDISCCYADANQRFRSSVHEQETPHRQRLCDHRLQWQWRRLSDEYDTSKLEALAIFRPWAEYSVGLFVFPCYWCLFSFRWRLQGQFNHACVIVEPLDHATHRVIFKCRDDLHELMGGPVEPKLVSDRNVSILSRQMAFHANVRGHFFLSWRVFRTFWCWLLAQPPN